MVHEEISIREKVVKLFPDENIVLNKKFNDRKTKIWFKDRDIIVEIMKEVTNVTIAMMKKRENTCLMT